MVANLERQAAAETDPARKVRLEERHRVQQDYMNAIGEVQPTPPNITLETKMTLFQVVADGSAPWLRMSVNQAAASIEGEVLEYVRSIARHDG